MPYFPPNQIGSETAASILAKLITVDGSGSGLDADTVDGLHANELSTVASLNDLTDVVITSPSNTQLLQYNGTNWVNATVSLGEGGGVTDHGALTGLSDNDHPQYYLASNVSSDAQSFLSAINSSLTYNNSTNRLTVMGGLVAGDWSPPSDSTTAVSIWNAARSARVVTVDTTNNRLAANRLRAGNSTALAYTTPLLWVDGTNATPQLQGDYANAKVVVTGGPYYGYENNANAIAFAFRGADASGSKVSVRFLGNASASLSSMTSITDVAGVSGHLAFYTAAVANTLTERVRIQSNGYVAVGQTSATALVDLAASSTARSSLRLRSGVAPTSPNEGDIWFDGTHLYCRIAGVTKQLDN